MNRKIGHETAFLRINETTPRNGECSFARLSNGNILFAYTEYCGDSRHDHAVARLCAMVSEDEGETWSPKRVIVEKDPEAQNIMSVSLANLPDGSLGMMYLRKEVMADKGITCMPCFRRSADNGETWEDEIRCQIPIGYYVVINDGALVTRGGRLLLPASYHGKRLPFEDECTIPMEPANEIHVLFSDDCGKTWGVLPGKLRPPFPSFNAEMAEPGIYEREDGSLWLWTRTSLGHQYDAISHDGGNTWSTLEPNLRFPSPGSPMRVKRMGNIAAAVFNPVPYFPLKWGMEKWRNPKRTPIVFTVSRDGGESFCSRGELCTSKTVRAFEDDTFLLEDDLDNSYCYPALLETRDGCLAAYYHSDGQPFTLTACKITKIYSHELEEKPF